MIQNFVTLDHASHIYTDTTGKTYTSVSHVLNTVEEKFDEETMSRNCAGKGKYVGLTQAQVKAQWRKTANESMGHGTKIHEELERYSKTFQVEDKAMEPFVKDIHATYNDYVRTYDECVLYHPDYMVAGTADKILLPTSRSKYVDVCDYKTSLNKGGIEYFNKYGKTLKYPVEHLQACSFSRYTMQLSLYGVLIENLTGKQIRHMWIRYIPADKPMEHIKIPIVYMKDSAIAILEHFRDMQQVKKLKDEFINTIEEPNFTI